MIPQSLGKNVIPRHNPRLSLIHLPLWEKTNVSMPTGARLDMRTGPKATWLQESAATEKIAPNMGLLPISIVMKRGGWKDYGSIVRPRRVIIWENQAGNTTPSVPVIWNRFS